MSSTDQNPRRLDGGPLVAITTDVEDAGAHGASPKLRAKAAMTYVSAVAAAGGVPILLPPCNDAIERYVAAFDAFVFTGGDDPRTEAFGEPTHPKATPMHPLRQAFELALFDALAARPERPVLGVCLGMQLMALHAGGRLNQHMPDDVPTADSHYQDRVHAIQPAGTVVNVVPPFAFAGNVTSHHRQAVRDAGRLVVLARSPDGVIEAIGDLSRRFYLGVQWHPERTTERALGIGAFEKLVDAAKA